jgi:hypothetical protein
VLLLALSLVASSCSAPEPGRQLVRLSYGDDVAQLVLAGSHGPSTLLSVPIESSLLDRVQAAHVVARDGVDVGVAVVHHGRHGGASLHLRRGREQARQLWRTAPSEDLGAPLLSQHGHQLAVELRGPTALADAQVGSAVARPQRQWFVVDLDDPAPRPRRAARPPWLDSAPARAVAAALTPQVLPGRMAWQAVSALSMPYIHQVYDTPDEFNGHWACGPTATLMAIQHFGRLPKKTITVKANGAHQSDYGAYISRKYTAFGSTFSRSQGDASGKPAKGAYGHCTDGGAAWAWRMQDYAKKHDLKSDFAGSSSFSKIKDHLSKGKVVVLSTQLTSAGHIITVKGTTANGKLIVNDPYGDRNKPNYPNAHGKGAIYSWAQVKAKWHITVHGTPSAPPLPRFKATLMGVTCPAKVVSGETVEVAVKLRNDGADAWNTSTRLGTTKPRDRASELSDAAWLKRNRVLDTGKVAPGAKTTLRFRLAAPAGVCEPRQLVEHFNLVQEGVKWFSAAGGPQDDAIALTITIEPRPGDPACASPIPEDAGVTADASAGPDAGPPESDGGVVGVFADAAPSSTFTPRLMVGGCGISGSRAPLPPVTMLLLLALALIRRR